MKFLYLLLCLYSTYLSAHSGFIDQNYPNSITSTEKSIYSFDSSFLSFESIVDLELKTRLTTFEKFKMYGKVLSGEMVKTKGNMQFIKSSLKKLSIDDLRGNLTLDHSTLEYSSFKDLKLTTFKMNGTRVFNSKFTHVTAMNSEFKDVIFHETYFNGVSMPGLVAENVKFLGRSVALNFRGCSLKNVEFNFEIVESLTLIDCRLENVFVNGENVSNVLP